MAQPTNLEQYMLELVNEARLNPLANAARYISSYGPLTATQANIQNALNFFGVNGAALQSAFNALVPVQPLAWSGALNDAAFTHNGLMIAFDQQSHQLPGEAGLITRFGAAGYTLTGGGSVAENIFAFTEDILQGHAGFMVDWGPGPNGMQNPPGHRNTIMNGSLREVGISVVAESNPGTSVGPLVVTQDFGVRLGGPAVFILGVAYNDTDANRFYTPGEGLGSLAISSGAASTTSAASGGYTLAIGAGSTFVTFTGAGLSAPVFVSGTWAAGSNVKLDIVNGNWLRTSSSVSVQGPVTTIEGLGLIGLTLFGDGGNQTFIGTPGADSLQGQGGNDTFIGNGGDDIFNGGTGTDRADYSAAPGSVNVYLYDVRNFGSSIGLAAFSSSLGSGTDYFISIEDVTGSANPDQLFGDANANILHGNGGSDVLRGLQGNDTITSGNTGTSLLQGDEGNDTLTGGTQRDIIDGGADNDTINGGGGNDELYAGTGTDNVNGGSGSDIIYIVDTLDTINGGTENDYLVWNLTTAANLAITNAMSIEWAQGRDAGDTINAAGISNFIEIQGQGGADTLTAGNGGSILLGGAGIDRLVGGSGVDHMVGGSEADTFRIATGGGTDYVYDFLRGTDRIDMIGTVGGFASLAVNSAYSGAGWYGYGYGSGTVWVNTGAGGALNAGDFIFV